MEEMQKAFNKTVIKLQNTSRIAEEQVSRRPFRRHLKIARTVTRLVFVISLPQDQRQTESIQLLQGQLENMTRLVLNLSVRVSQLQVEVETNAPGTNLSSPVRMMVTPPPSRIISCKVYLACAHDITRMLCH